MKNIQSSLGFFLFVSIFLQVFVKAKFLSYNVENQNLVRSSNTDNKIARLEPFIMLMNPQNKDVTDDDDEYDYDLDGEAEPSYVKLIQEAYNNNRYARLEHDDWDDQRHARLIPKEETQRFAKLITDDVDLSVSDFEDSPNVNDNASASDEVDHELVETSEDDDIFGVDSKSKPDKKHKRHPRKNKAKKGKCKKCGRKCRGKGKGRHVVNKHKEAANEKRKNKRHKHGHKVKKCSRSSKVCCDGTVPNFYGKKSTPVCLGGGKPKCSLKECKTANTPFWSQMLFGSSLFDSFSI